MRFAPILLAGVTLSGMGCSALIHHRGAESSAPKNTQEVRAQLGEPLASGKVEGVRYEQFESRKKYVDLGYAGEYYIFGMMATGGLIEVLLTPRELYLQSKRLAFGQHILVCYDERDGRVLSFEVNRSGWKPLRPQHDLTGYLGPQKEPRDTPAFVTSRSESEEPPVSPPAGSSPTSSSPPR